MARKPRIHVPDGFYHVVLIGNNGKDIFLSVSDSLQFEKLITEGIERYEYKIHAYCWLKNRVHLFIQVADAPLSKIVQNLSFRYTIYFNNKTGNIGHLFAGRYKAVLIDPQDYLLQLVRYIHLIPFRVSIVNKPHEYKWSSHRAYLGRDKCRWLTTERVLSHFPGKIKRVRESYDQYINEDIEVDNSEHLLSKVREGRIMGSREFMERYLNHPNEKSEKAGLDIIIKEVCGRFNLEAEEIYSRSRSRRLSKIRTIIGYFVLEYGDKTLSDFCRLVNRDVSTLSGAITKFRQQLKGNDQDRQLISELKNNFGIQ